MKSIKKVNYPLTLPMWLIIFLLVTAIALITSACADPQTDRSENTPKETEEQLQAQETSKDLPPEVLQAVRKEIADNYQVNPEEIEVTEATSQVWPDGCLGLAKEDEACSLALVDGWRVKVKSDARTWVYRTDNRGYSVRLESQSN